jgi:hypothetical protein
VSRWDLDDISGCLVMLLFGGGIVVGFVGANLHSNTAMGVGVGMVVLSLVIVFFKNIF